MQRHAKIAVTLAAIGTVLLLAWKFLEPYFVSATQNQVSDAGEKGTIVIGIDGWVGYFPLCSPEYKRRMNRFGYGVRCVDDNADYQDRFNKLKRNEYHFAVATVDSYALNGRDHSYPGPIVAVIDESKGGDAIVAKKATIPNMEALKNAADVRVAFTPDSPSHHLMKAVASHFDVPAFREKRNHVLADGSENALQLLQSGKADLAIVWEPEVSKALQHNDIQRILGTEDTQRLIVDVLIASQRTVRDQPELVETVLKAFFATMKHYRLNTDELVSHISKHYRISEEVSRSLLGGVAWVSLIDNAEEWFGTANTGIPNQSLVESIESAVSVLIEHQDVNANPLPNEDAYALINSQFIASLYQSMAYSGGFTTPAASVGNQHAFSALTASQWNLLKEIGSLKSRHITFASGADALTLEGKKEIDRLVDDLSHYPNFRIEIRGHTGTRGDRDANMTLSQDRANAVMRYLILTHDIEENRARSIGFGGTKPLAKKPGESSRAYNYRLPRVEIVLLREEV